MRALRTALIIAALTLLAACGRSTAAPTSTPNAVDIGTILLPGTPAASASPTSVSTAVSTPDNAVIVATGSATRGAPNLTVATPTPLAVTRAAGTAASRTAQSTPTGTAKPGQPTAAATTATSARATDLPSSPPQQVVGTREDGLVLLNVRSANHDGYTRLVFDLTNADGSAAPVPHTQVWTQGNTVIVALTGVRNDQFGQSLGGAELPINLGSVGALYRIPVRDDASVAYGITIKPGAQVKVSSTTGPARVIVDISDS